MTVCAAGSGQDDILASDEHQATLTEQLQPVYSALLNVMVQKSMLPKDPGEYSPDEAEAFRRYRQDILDFYVSHGGPSGPGCRRVSVTVLG